MLLTWRHTEPRHLWSWSLLICKEYFGLSNWRIDIYTLKWIIKGNIATHEKWIIQDSIDVFRKKIYCASHCSNGYANQTLSHIHKILTIDTWTQNYPPPPLSIPTLWHFNLYANKSATLDEVICVRPDR